MFQPQKDFPKRRLDTRKSMRDNIAHMHTPGAYPDAFTDQTFPCIEEQLGTRLRRTEEPSVPGFYFPTILRSIENIMFVSIRVASVIHRYFGCP